MNPCIDRTVHLRAFKKGGFNRVQRSRTDIGGKGVNVAVQLRNFIRKPDPHAFMMITNSSEIIGKGFRGLN